jgi:hypothetical protein
MMPLDDRQKTILFHLLEAQGWRLKEDSIEAPNGSIWILRNQPWHLNLASFHETMYRRLERIKKVAFLSSKPEHLISDTASLVDVLEKMMTSPES